MLIQKKEILRIWTSGSINCLPVHS
jgi:hypothetical protein